MCIFFIALSPVLNRCSKQIKQLPFFLSASISSHKKKPNKLPLVNKPKHLNTKKAVFLCPPVPVDVEVSFHLPQSEKYFTTTFTPTFPSTAFSMSPNCSFPSPSLDLTVIRNSALFNITEQSENTCYNFAREKFK